MPRAGKAKEQLNWKMVRPKLGAAGVALPSAGIDDDTVKNAQTSTIARFDSKIVKMDDDGTSKG
ncbi:MAG: hypothetical protein ACK41E_06395 [Deinococcales bacterium]